MSQPDRAFSAFAAFSASLLISTAAWSTPVLGLDVTNGGATYIRGTFANFGWTFSTSEARQVTALGLFDVNANGLVDSHQVGIWDSNGTLLVTTSVDTNDPLTSSASTLGDWRFRNVAPVLLAAGDYTIGAYYPTDQEAFLGSDGANEVQMSLPSWLSYGEGRVTVGAFGNMFGMPDTPNGATFQPAWFGPNFISNTVPLPATAPLVLLGLLLLGASRRSAPAAR